MRVDDFDYDLPRELIAQEGVYPRDAARLMVLPEGGGVEHRGVRDLPSLLQPSDLLVVNESRVLPARVRCRKVTGGRAELLFLGRLHDGTWDAVVGGGRLREGSLLLAGGREVELVRERGPGRYAVAVTDGSDAIDLMREAGEMPTPPYIRTRLEDQDRYQTTFARVDGSVAAPTAGLHLNDAMFSALGERGVEVARLVLHVGYGTFRPVRAELVEDHVMETEHAEISAELADGVNAALDDGRRVLAVGTTTVRALESATDGAGRLGPFSGMTDLFIFPPYEFSFPYSGLLTNFHLPRSTLLMLVSAYAGRERVLGAYEVAKREGYRFYSLGDAMLMQGGPSG